MKLITVKKIYQTLLSEKPEIILEEDIILRAVKPIRRMLDISAALGL
jgi:quinolinate synthase